MADVEASLPTKARGASRRKTNNTKAQAVTLTPTAAEPSWNNEAKAAALTPPTAAAKSWHTEHVTAFASTATASTATAHANATTIGSASDDGFKVAIRSINNNNARKGSIAGATTHAPKAGGAATVDNNYVPYPRDRLDVHVEKAIAAFKASTS